MVRQQKAIFNKLVLSASLTTLLAIGCQDDNGQPQSSEKITANATNGTSPSSGSSTTTNYTDNSLVKDTQEEQINQEDNETNLNNPTNENNDDDNIGSDNQQTNIFTAYGDCSTETNSITITKSDGSTEIEECVYGCNYFLSGCACNGGNATCNAVYSPSFLAPLANITNYCHPYNRTILGHPSIGFRANSECKYYCGFQWLKAEGTTIIGYIRTLKFYNQPHQLFLCTTDADAPLNQWPFITDRIINDGYSNSDVEEFIYKFENMQPNTKYTCAFVQSESYSNETFRVSDGGSIFTCPTVNHDETNELPYGTFFEPNTMGTTDIIRTVTTGE